MKYEDVVVFTCSIYTRNHFHVCVYRWRAKVKWCSKNFIKYLLIIVDPFNLFLAVSNAYH